MRKPITLQKNMSGRTLGQRSTHDSARVTPKMLLCFCFFVLRCVFWFPLICLKGDWFLWFSPGSKCDWFWVWHQLSCPHNSLASAMFKAATSTLSSRLNAKALQTGYKGEHTYKGELTKATYLFTHVTFFFSKKWTHLQKRPRLHMWTFLQRWTYFDRWTQIKRWSHLQRWPRLVEESALVRGLTFVTSVGCSPVWESSPA